MVLCFTSCKDTCENITCPTGRTCINGTCECHKGFSGENCSKENICITQNIKCQNTGICQNGECICLDGYSGTNCEIATAKIVWERHYGGSGDDIAYDFALTNDGGYIVVGNTNSNDGDVSGNNGASDIWIVKLNENGNIIWENSYGGPNAEEGASIQQTTDGGYIVTGNTVSKNDDAAQYKGRYDIWILRLDNKGILQWEKTYGGTNWEYVSNVQQTTDGGFIVAASALSNDRDVGKNNGGYDYWILKLDRSGNIKWSKIYGGENSDVTSFIKQTFDGGYIAAGISASNSGDVGGNNGNFDYWIVKLDRSGSLVWEKNYGGAFYDFASSILQVEDGSYIVAGHSASVEVDPNTSDRGQDPWILKLDKNGNLQWEKRYQGEEYDFANSIQQTNNGGYIIAGTSISTGDGRLENFMYDCLLMKVDKFGTLELKTRFGTKDRDVIYAVEQTRDGSYTLAGFTDFGNYISDYFVVKVNFDQ